MHVSTTYIEPDDVASNDHTHTLNQVTDDVNEGSTDVDVLFVTVVFLSLEPLPKLPFTNTPTATPTFFCSLTVSFYTLFFTAGFIGVAAAPFSFF